VGEAVVAVALVAVALVAVALVAVALVAVAFLGKEALGEELEAELEWEAGAQEVLDVERHAEAAAREREKQLQDQGMTSMKNHLWIRWNKHGLMDMKRASRLPIIRLRT
jgi:hypothetical protein